MLLVQVHFYIIGVLMFILGQVNSIMVLTANVADIKKFAQKLVPEALADNLATFVAKLAEIHNNMAEDDKLGKKYGKLSYSNAKTDVTRASGSTKTYIHPEYDERETTTRFMDAISYENLRYQSDPKNVRHKRREFKNGTSKPNKKQSIHKNVYIRDNQKKKQSPEENWSDSAISESTEQVTKKNKLMNTIMEFNDNNELGENFHKQIVEPNRSRTYKKQQYLNGDAKRNDQVWYDGSYFRNKHHRVTTLKERTDFDQYDNMRKEFHKPVTLHESDISHEK